MLYYLCYSCGLAVLAMALRPLMTCEVAVGGGMYGGSYEPEGQEGTSELKNRMLHVIKSNQDGYNLDHSNNENYFCKESLNTQPMTLHGLHAIANKYLFSNYGEMFSAQTMYELGKLSQNNRYKVQLVKHDLLKNFNKDQWNGTFVRHFESLKEHEMRTNVSNAELLNINHIGETYHIKVEPAEVNENQEEYSMDSSLNNLYEWQEDEEDDIKDIILPENRNSIFGNREIINEEQFNGIYNLPEENDFNMINLFQGVTTNNNVQEQLIHEGLLSPGSIQSGISFFNDNNLSDEDIDNLENSDNETIIDGDNSNYKNFRTQNEIKIPNTTSLPLSMIQCLIHRYRTTYDCPEITNEANNEVNHYNNDNPDPAYQSSSNDRNSINLNEINDTDNIPPLSDLNVVQRLISGQLIAVW